jgi:hypothetical protein
VPGNDTITLVNTGSSMPGTPLDGKIARILPSMLACGIALGALALRVHDLDATSLWGDEAHTARRASSLRGLVLEWKLAPLYLVTRSALIFGSSETILRLPHALIGAASVLLLYWVAGAVSNRRVGLVASLCLAISPFHVLHSREARYYSLMVFFSLLSLHFLTKSIAIRRLAPALAFVAVGLVGFHDHALSAIPFAALGIYGLIAWRWRGAGGSPGGARPAASWKAWAVAGVSLALVVYFLNPRLWQAASRWIADGEQGRFQFALDTDLLGALAIWLGGGPGPPSFIYPALFALGLAALGARRLAAFPLIITVAVETFLSLELIEWIGPRHPFRLRYLIFLLPFYLIGVAAGLCLVMEGVQSIVRRVTGWPSAGAALAECLPLVLALAVFVPLDLPGLRNVYRYQLADYRGAVEVIAAGMKEGDAIALLPYRAERNLAGFQWYLARRGLPMPPGGPAIVRSPAELQALVETSRRVWALELEPPDLDPAEADPGLTAWLHTHVPEAARLPSRLWNARLGPPVLEEEVVIRTSPEPRRTIPRSE